MKKFIYSLKLIIAIVLITSFNFSTAKASETEPIITFKTNIYQTNGELNQFSLVIGGTEDGGYIDIDCGYGKVEYILEKSTVDSTQSISGTFVDCKVSSEGIVKIYGDASKIDYFNASGCYISEINLTQLSELAFLDLSHNELKDLDLSNLTKLQGLYLSDNPFNGDKSLIIGKNKPKLTILEMNTVDNIDQSFNLSDYPAMVSFDGYHNLGLNKLDPTGCPDLMRLTLDVTNVETLDISKNPNLLILNISNTRISSIDLSNNPYLTQLYCAHDGSFNEEYKLKTLDISNNPELVYLFCAGNNLKTLDISKCNKLVTLVATDNYLTSIDVSNNPQLYIFEINKNCLDFATLPFPNSNWNTYYYGQRNLHIAKYCKVDTILDFSSKVLREGTTTEAALYSVSESSPNSPTLLDASYYTYSNGKLKILKEHEDSVYIAFANSAFPEAILNTEKFKIKNESQIGIPDKALSFTSGVSVGSTISFCIGAEGATESNPVKFYVNFGDGNKIEYTTTTASPQTPNVNGTKNGYGSVEIYIPEGVTLSAFKIADVPMYSIDVKALASLRELSIINAGLYSIDLSWNRCLTSLNLSGNNFSSLSLAGNNGYYEKNALTDINLSNNKLTDIILNNVQAIKHLDLSYNELTTLDLSDADYILSVDLSNNLFESLDFTYCSIMTRLDVSHNNLSSIVMPTDCGLQYFACNNNNFTIATLPIITHINDENYIYAPQTDLAIPTKGPGIDLSNQNRIINGVGTTYTWKDANGISLIEGSDYTNTNGYMKFLNTEVGEIVCEMQNAAFPGFNGDKVFKTTPILAAGMPTNEIASFSTVNDGETVTLSLAASQPNTAIYIGWDGNENLSQYLLGTTYQLFDAKTKAGVDVKVYTYEPEEKISVFSMSGATLSTCDMSKLTDAINVSITNAGLNEINLPISDNLKETALDGNNFTEFNASKFPNLTTLSLNNNALTTLDVTNNPSLQVLSVASNQLNEIKLNNNNIWALYLDNNKFSEIDLNGVPNVSQFTITNNQLSEINVENLTQLKMLGLTGNKLTFKTLPKVKSSYIVYHYSNQAPIDISQTSEGIINLADQAIVDTTKTVYRWFLGTPIINEYGELEGEELILDTEYTIENGVTTFLNDFEGVICVMTNSKFPNLYLYTNLIDVTAGVECIISDNPSSIVIVEGNNIIAKTDVGNSTTANLITTNGAIIGSTTTIDGTATFNNVADGIYIITIGNESYKVAIK
ncbi:MAG: hypothetical protein E7081_06060 [Bacteroidales bacterium]|nr:hypothetical protein [Bacteroidales bacterium]